MRSIIVFSDRCTLKNIQIQSQDICVINRHRVAPVVSDICSQVQSDLLTENDIAEIYDKLYPYTQVDEIAKMQHIANIHSHTPSKPVQKINVIPMQVVQQNQPETETEPKDSAVIGADTQPDETNEVPDVESTEPIKLEVTERQVLKCPKCNGDLILRTATRGANAGKRFYGCSNYPKCRYIRTEVTEK